MNARQAESSRQRTAGSGQQAAGSRQHAAGWTQQPARSSQHAVRSATYLLPAACCLLPAVRCLLPAACCLLAAACCLLLAPPVHAKLDPESKKPYQLQIVLQVGSNRVFTPLFQEQLQRDVQNQLRLAFGELARIEVVRAHPLLRDIETKGLDQAIEPWESLSEFATHFVLLDYVAGTYQMQTRFHDGMTGQAGPFSKRAQTSDRAAVASAVVQMIEASFCPVGTVTAVGKDVTLILKGGELGIPMDRWVKPGHVFAVSRIIDESGRHRGSRLEWALLELLDPPAAGVCRCKYWRRYQEDDLRENSGTLGYRALRLTTTQGPVKLQLLDEAGKPLEGVTVQVRRPGAKPTDLNTNRDGLAVSRDIFAHFALVQVFSGTSVRAEFPMALIEGRTVVVRVKLDAAGESLVSLEVRRDAWLRRVYDNVRMSSERSQELSIQLNQSLEAALEAARKSLPMLVDEIKYLDHEHQQLSQLVKEKKLAYDLSDGRLQIDELRTQAAALQAFVKRIDDALKTSGGEKALGLRKLVERAGLLEADADFDAAIRLYEQVMTANPNEMVIKAKLDQLKKAWTPRNEKHAQARAFIYNVWPALDLAGLQKNQAIAREAVATCRAADDKLSLQKMLRINVTHMVRLKRQLETLKRRDSEDNRNQAKTLAQISGELLRMHGETSAFVGVRKE